MQSLRMQDIKKNRIQNYLQAVRVLTNDGKIIMITEDIKMQVNDGILLSAIFHLTPGSKKVLWERGNEAMEYRMKKS